VLDAFPPADQPLVEQMVDGAVEAIVRVVKEGISSAMNTTNRRSKT
jgi:peptidyl-tRNA hydrolase